MWVSKKKWSELEKSVADLEEKIQSQQKILLEHMKDHEKENEDLKNIFKAIKNEVYKGVQQTL